MGFLVGIDMIIHCRSFHLQWDLTSLLVPPQNHNYHSAMINQQHLESITSIRQ